jgi:hypothetical protein
MMNIFSSLNRKPQGNAGNNGPRPARQALLPGVPDHQKSRDEVLLVCRDGDKSPIESICYDFGGEDSNLLSRILKQANSLIDIMLSKPSRLHPKGNDPFLAGQLGKKSGWQRLKRPLGRRYRTRYSATKMGVSTVALITLLITPITQQRLAEHPQAHRLVIGGHNSLGDV